MNWKTRCKICKKEWIEIISYGLDTYSPDCSCHIMWHGNPQDIIEVICEPEE